MKKLMYAISVVSLIMTFVFYVTFITTKLNIFLTLGIAMMTICYHITVRLVIGSLCSVYCTSENIDPSEQRFQPKRFERGLYRALKVRFWKDKFPSWDTEHRSLRTHSVDELIFESCRSEVSHRLSALAGFAVLFFTVWFGGFAVILTTCILGGLIDMSYVAVQRFNRPRLTRIAATGRYN